MINGLPERLRETREKYMYSQRDVAKLLGVSPSLISGYETGERTPSVEVLFHLSYLYKCSVDYLLGKSSGSSDLTLSLEGLSQRQIRIITSLLEEFRSES